MNSHNKKSVRKCRNLLNLTSFRYVNTWPKYYLDKQKELISEGFLPEPLPVPALVSSSSSSSSASQSLPSSSKSSSKSQPHVSSKNALSRAARSAQLAERTGSVPQKKRQRKKKTEEKSSRKRRSNNTASVAAENTQIVVDI